MKNKRHIAPYRRKREGRTDYKKRLKMLVSGTPRLIIRKTNKNIIVQIALYAENGDNVLVTANSLELKKHGWKFATGNTPAAYLTGMLAAQKAKSKSVKNAIVDLGLQSPLSGSRLYAAVKGAIDNGLSIPCSEKVFPTEDRILGKHIVAYGQTSKQFNTSPADMESVFNSVKQKLSK